MVLFNHATRELTAKIVYYGPGLCGKTTNLKVLHERLEKGTAGRLLSLSTAQDRTIYFDLLPVELGNIKGYTVRFQLCTVPGQVFYNETRKLVLRGVDGLVFVVDSQWSMLSHNLESFQNLKENVKEAGASLEALPVVIQYNKRDLNGVLPVETLQESLSFQNYPFVEAVASEGKGVVETFKLVSKLTFVDLLRRLQKTGGIEDLAAPAPEAPDPGEETMVRSHRAEKRTSFVDAAIRTAAPFSAPEGTADPAIASDSPFDTSAGWVAPPPGEVFGGPPGAGATSAAEPFLVPPALGPDPSLLESPFAAATSADARSVAVADATPPPITIAAPVTAPAAPVVSAAASSHEIGDLKARIEDLAARVAAFGAALTTLESGTARVDALEAMRERVDGLVGVMRHEVSQRVDPAARGLADLKNAFEASVERQTEAVTELRHAISREIAAAFEERQSSMGSAATERLRDEMMEKVARILADERDSLDGRRKEDLASLKAELERHEARSTETLRELGTLRNDLESATNGLRLEFTSLLAKTAEEAAAGRDGFARELESMRKSMDGFTGGEREARSALEGKLSAFEAALERLRGENEAAHGRAHERLSAAEDRARRLADAIRKAFEGLP